MRRTLRSRPAALRMASRFHFENLEPRVLLSASGDQLMITEKPFNVVAGFNISPTGQEYEVQVVGPDYLTDTSYNGNVTISFTNSEGQTAPVTGTLTVKAQNGIAIFSDLVFPAPDQYTPMVTDD